ncbi:MAG: HAMP domain-containing histidine kinase [Acidimicrobiia bacterium]|nr:HAMP domain-containing histidine kinase [Acidimicrobiia bacterium]
MRRRILASIIAVTVIAVILFATPLAIALSDLHHEEEVVRLERTAAEAAEDVPARFPSPSEPIKLRTENGREVGLYGRDGTLISGRGPATADATVRSALRGDVHDHRIGSRIAVALPVTRGEKVVGALRASINGRAVTDRTRNSVLVMSVIGALAVGVSAIVGWRQARRLARPIDHLAEVATRLGDGDFTVRADVSGIPEVDAVSTALESTATRLDRMLRRERTLSEDTSHQLRTPLTSLRVTLEAARLDPDSDRDAVLVAALAEVDRLDRTIDDLLTLAREVPTAHPATDLVAVLDEVGTAWTGRVEAEGRRLEVSSEGSLPAVAISDRAVRQVIDVLLDNSLRHGSGTITVRARRASTGVVVEVADKGTHTITEEQRVFERRSSSAGGHGIGLALARALAESEGARLALVRPGPEPMFALSIPAAPAP